MTALNTSTHKESAVKPPIENGSFYSVEFMIDEPYQLYQFKIWQSETSAMFVLVKENSDVLPKLRAGSVLNMTYYSSDAHCPKKQIQTRIGHITSQREGRFEGHCTVSLVPVTNASLQN